MPTTVLRRMVTLTLIAALCATVVTTSSARAATTGDPFAGRELFVDPDAAAAREADRLRDSDPQRAALFDRIGDRPQADWFGDELTPAAVHDAVATRTATIRRAGALPVFVAYAIPARDCGQHSAGGVGSPAAYRDWIQAFASGLDGAPAVVVLEPDALAQLDCLAPAARQDRLALLRYAVGTLGAAGASVHLDAGHSGWHPAATMAQRLRAAGVEEARGFALNVSNHRWTDTEVAYARDLSARTDGARAVIDTSRNGRGPAPDGQWCNPDGRGLGPAPTTATADPVVDAYLWVKRPGESDGTCNGGPPAGEWWPAAAEGLAARALMEPRDASLPSRVAGADRVATALAVARAAWERAGTVVLARSDDPADALAGTSLAGHLDAPLLITDPAELDPRVTEEVRRLGADEVVVLGGPAAIADEVVDGLHDTGARVRRVAGATRAGTAAAVASEVTSSADTALLVHERSWPDALAVSGLAARRAAVGAPWPVLLAGEGLPTTTLEALDRLGVRRVLVVGGPAVLPDTIDEQVRATGRDAERLAGPTRHATSVAAARQDMALHGGGPLLLATSGGFADGLAAGGLAARSGGVVLLTPGEVADDGQLDWVARTGAALSATVAVGGEVAIADATRRAIERARTSG